MADGADAYLDIWVKPGARRASVGGTHDGRTVVAVSAKPVDGAANRAVLAAVADHLGIKSSRVTVHRGEHSRRKTLRITDPDPDLVDRLHRLVATVER